VLSLAATCAALVLSRRIPEARVRSVVAGAWVLMLASAADVWWAHTRFGGSALDGAVGGDGYSLSVPGRRQPVSASTFFIVAGAEALALVLWPAGLALGAVDREP
jgi:hypothetical protein